MARTAAAERSISKQAAPRFVNANLGEYDVPANADVHDIDVIFVDEPDDIINPLGIKGGSEIGWSGQLRRSPTRSTMQPANGCATCRSLRIRYCRMHE